MAPLLLLLRTLSRLAAAVATAGAALPAAAQDFTSQYTSTATKNCKRVDAAKENDGDWSIWQCAGLGGNVVRVTESDLRMTVSIGRDLAAAAASPAAKQQFGPWNNVHDTLEWRSSGGRPFATIQRWFLSDTTKTDRKGNPTQVGMLIVTRLAPACHVAYVDAAANGNANVLARQAADLHAREFDCDKPPMVVGRRGRAIELALP